MNVVASRTEEKVSIPIFLNSFEVGHLPGVKDDFDTNEQLHAEGLGNDLLLVALVLGVVILFKRAHEVDLNRDVSN